MEGCTVSSHTNQKVPLEKRKVGWYLEAGGTARAGACLDIFFLVGSEGPVVQAAEPLLVGEGGLKLTFGHWHGLHVEWVTGEVWSLDGSSRSENDEVVAQAEEANEYEQEPLSSNRAPLDIDMTHEDEQPVLGSLEPEAIESFLQDVFTRQNARVSEKLKEHDSSLQR
jgi:hypothetical protein